MAYLSRTFGAAGDDRRRPVGPALPAGVGGPGAGPAGIAPPPVNEGQGDPGAIRAMFSANRDQGAAVLGGLADSLNKRIAGAPGGFQALPAIAPGSASEAWSVDADGNPVHVQAQPNLADYVRSASPRTFGRTMEQYQRDLDAWNKAQSDAKATHDKSVDAAKGVAAQNTATLAPLQADVGQLGTMEGQQTLLAGQRSGAGYSPGQSRLDAWLTGAAANSNPDVLGGVQKNLGTLQAKAGWDGEGMPPGSPPLPPGATPPMPPGAVPPPGAPIGTPAPRRDGRPPASGGPAAPPLDAPPASSPPVGAPGPGEMSANPFAPQKRRGVREYLNG